MGATSGFTLAKAIACAVEFDNQHCGIYASDEDSYIDFADVFDPLIMENHGLSGDFKHTSDMDATKITKNVDPEVPVHSCRIRVGRSIQGFGLSPGITKQQRVDVEALMINAFKTLEGDLAGNYYALTGMDEAIRQQLVDDHFLSVSSPCKRVVMSRVFSSVLPWVSQLSANPSRLNLARTSKSPPNSVISTLAQPTWELVCVLLSTLTSPAGPRTPLTL